jgi:hypothetical protein
MLYEDRLYGFAVAAMGCVCWGEPGAAEQAVDIAVEMEAAFSATLKSRRDAAEQAAKKAREDAVRAEAAPSGGPLCIHCGHAAKAHAVDDEERRECMSTGCGCRQYECAAVQP